MKKETYYKELKDKGFSLVEIVVIIAIMIVLLAVLAPSLLRYTETSRMQKDHSAMDELCGTVQLALADAEIFDEACSYAILNNYITYTDSSGVYGAKYTDEEFWAPDGSGEAVTITFNPDENGNYTIANGLVNDMTYGNGSVADSRTAEGLKQCYFNEMGDGKLYHKVEQTFGATFTEKSATYKNSSYTVFIKLDVVNGIKRANVYGEWNGTNLSPDCPASLGSGTNSYIEEEPEQTKNGGTTQSNFTSSDLQGSGGGSGNIPSYKDYLPCGHAKNEPGDHSQKECGHYRCEENECGCVPAPCGVEGHWTGDGLDHETKVYHTSTYQYKNPHVYACQCQDWIVPEGGVYVRTCKTNEPITYVGGDAIPCSYEAEGSDYYLFGDYKYVMNMTEDLWCVTLNLAVTDKNQIRYGEIVDYEIKSKPVGSMYQTFYGCVNLVEAPKIPSSIWGMSWTFKGCKNLKTYAGSAAPDGDFTNYLPNTISHMEGTFEECERLIIAPILPTDITYIRSVFSGCTNMTTAPILPNKISDLRSTFSGCKNLVTYHGSNAPDGDFSNYKIPSTTINMMRAFSNCEKMTYAPDMNAATEVKYLQSTFASCKNLRGDIVFDTNHINNKSDLNNPGSCANCFSNVNMAKITLAGNSSDDVKRLIGSTGKNYCSICVTNCKDIGGHHSTCVGGKATCQNKAICEVCDKEYGSLASCSGGTSTCQTRPNCQWCGREYGNVGYHSGGTATCQVKAICKWCNQEYGSLSGHKGGKANCQSKAICSVCNQEYGNLGVHDIRSNVCTVCGEAGAIETPHSYSNSQNYVVLGSWDYSDAKSVNITIEYETESASLDWVSIVEGHDYVTGTSYNQTNNYLNTSGNVVSTTGTNSSVKFGGSSRTTKTFTNVNMLKGTVIFRSDSSVQRWGAKITIIPNY